MFAVTASPDGANLPQKYMPWNFFKTIDLVRGRPTPGLEVEECLNDLDAYGLHVTDAHVRITEEALK